MESLLDLLDKHGNLTIEEMSTMLGRDAAEIAAEIDEYKNAGIIVGNKLIINWQKTAREFVTALIEVKVTPKFGRGFDEIAERFYQYEQVKSVYLMSGGYDIALIIEGKTLTEVALFVSQKLAPMDTVISTATHFVLKKYKEDGMLLEIPHKDERQVISF
ncbi:MAG: Lrp/AsnC family transcriptional regulator [Ruminococcaceae bacterium]|nr:Lrp/AsnC family transcriptional regulator [Oscillospiraceae bacterium]